jgi:hypothetical protein
VHVAWSWQGGVPGLRLWLAILCTAHALDVVTTAIGLRLGIAESNPLMYSVLHLNGELSMYGLKIAIVVLLVLAIGPIQQRYRRIWPILLLMTAPAVLVVINNVALIAEAGG